MSIQKSNRLGAEKSPYLLQHKDNPVHWFAWGEEAFRAARAENKIIFLSVGYSTCYWCHMMEKDSFEKPEVAAVMNAHFINIKVDREEHPDVDQIYMDAVTAMTGRGGWPMSVFLTPDREPFFGGTFFWQDQFVQILQRVAEEWQKNPDNLRDFGRKVVTALSAEDVPTLNGEISVEPIRQAFVLLKRRFDPAYGGFGAAPKFPHATDIALLLRIHARTGSAEALTMAVKTLDEMARGGLYDHVGGGFHRYATDACWLVPHFEKMLYDNALLALVYLEAYQLTKKRLYAEVARQTLDYVLREMRDAGGGFYSAQDAGEVGREGEFYVWTAAELKAALSETERALVHQLYGATERGNWEEGKNILHVPDPAQWEKALSLDARLVREKLFAARNKRAHPHKDEKILTSWNGLMISAMAKGFQVLEDEKYLAAARESALFIQQVLYKNGGLLRRYCDGDSRFAGTLDDHAYLIDGLLRLFESDFDDRWLAWAEELQASQDAKFWAGDSGGYFFAAGNEDHLVIRKKEFHDSSIPSGNAVSALNLQRLAALALKPAYAKRARELLGLYAAQMQERSPIGFGTALVAFDFATDAREIAVIGSIDDAATARIRRAVYDSFQPNAVLAVGGVGASTQAALIREKSTIDDETTVYVCRNNACQKPTTDMAVAEALITERNNYSI